MDLEKIIKTALAHYKKVIFCIIFYLIALNLIRFGFFATLFIVAFSFIGYKLGDEKHLRKIKKLIRSKLEE